MKTNFLSSLLLFLISIYAYAQQSPTALLKEQTSNTLEHLIESSPAITGLAVIDLSTGEKMEFNSQLIFPQASAIKVPILMEVFHQADQGKFSLSDEIEIQQKNLVGGSGILSKLEAPGKMSIRNLSILMIALSDNSATNELIDLVGMSNVTSKMESLGFEHTKLQRKMMDGAASLRRDENLSTPADATALLELLYRGKFVSESVSQEIVAILKKTGRADSRLAPGVPANVEMGFKYGELNGVWTEWALVFLKNRPYAVAVMESFKIPGQSEQVIEDISKVLYAYFSRLGKSEGYGNYVRD